LTRKPAKPAHTPMSQEDWSNTLKRSISSMKSGDPRGPQHSSTDYNILRSTMDQKLNETKKKGLTDDQARMLAHGGSIKRADKWAKKMRSGKGDTAPETEKILTGLAAEIMKSRELDKDTTAGTGRTPPRKGSNRKWGDPGA